MKQSTLEILDPLLTVLRAHPALREVRPATFDLNGQEFVHFHEGPDGVIGDVLLVKGRLHMPASSPVEQAELLERIDAVLDSLERRQRSRQRRSSKRRGSFDE